MSAGEENKRVGRMARDNSDRLRFEWWGVKYSEYEWICQLVAKDFRLEPLGTPIEGLDEIFQNYSRDGLIVSLEWDIWSEFIVVANSEAAEPLVMEIARWLDPGMNAMVTQVPKND